MTAAALLADIAPPRRDWRSLLWVLPLTGLWIAVLLHVLSLRQLKRQTVAGAGG